MKIHFKGVQLLYQHPDFIQATTPEERHKEAEQRFDEILADRYEHNRRYEGILMPLPGANIPLFFSNKPDVFMKLLVDGDELQQFRQALPALDILPLKQLINRKPFSTQLQHYISWYLLKQRRPFLINLESCEETQKQPFWPKLNQLAMQAFDKIKAQYTKEHNYNRENIRIIPPSKKVAAHLKTIRQTSST